MPTIQQLHSGPLRIPFRERFVHSLASRDAMASVWCRIEDGDGHTGWGEGCPRTYVSGEAMGPTLAGLRVLGDRLRGAALDTLDDITALLDTHAPAHAPALRCAAELALLDLLGRATGRGVAELLDAAGGQVRYSAVISSERPPKVEALARMGVALGLVDYKLKVGLDLDANLARLAALREVIGPEPSVRVDANAAWSLDEALVHVAALHERGVTLFEQPLAAEAGPEARLALRALRGRMPAAAQILVDESLVSLDDLDVLLTDRVADRFLLKVSKQGGPLRTLAFARRAAAAGIPCHLGNHVGESSLLSAAGRVVAGAHAFETVEGSFGLLLLESDITPEPLAFGPGGWAPVRYAEGPGWGFEVTLP